MLVVHPCSCVRLQRTKICLAPSHAVQFNAKIVRKTIERTIERMHYISQPKYSMWHRQMDVFNDGRCYVDDEDDTTNHIALICIISILLMYGLVIILKSYEKANDQ